MADFYAKYVGSGSGGGGSGDVVGPASSDDNGLVLFDGTTGKEIKEATGTGFVKVSSGVFQTPSATVSLTSEVSGILPVANGGTNSSTSLNNNRVMISSGSAIVEATAITASRAVVSNASGIPIAATTTATEIGYVNGVTSSIQTQLDSKQASGNYITALTGDVTATGPGSVAATIANSAVTDAKVSGSAGIQWSKLQARTASRAMVTDLSGYPTVSSSVTSVEVSYLQGVTNFIQTQLDGKQASDATLTALAAYNTNGLMTQTAADTFTGRTLTGTTNRITVTNGNGVSGNPTVDISSSYVGQNTITTLGTITTGTWTGSTIAIANGGTGQTSASNAFNALAPTTTKGDLIAYSTTNARLPVGSNNQVLTADSSQTLGVKWAAPGTNSFVRVGTGNGYGSTNTTVRRFSTSIDSAGTDITYADSATLGATFTINTTGIYSISYSDQFSGAADMGITVNSSQLTTNVQNITQANRLAIQTTGAANFRGNCAWTGRLAATDVIRMQADTSTNGSVPANSNVSICLVAYL